MSSSTVSNIALGNQAQALAKSIVVDNLQKLSVSMAACNPGSSITKCVRYGEKTVLPFADDMFEIVRYRFQQKSEVTEDKWRSAKKDFKRCKGGLNSKHGMMRTPKKSFSGSTLINLSKSSSMALMAVTTSNMMPSINENGISRNVQSTDMKFKHVLPQQFKKLPEYLSTSSMSPPNTVKSGALSNSDQSDATVFELILRCKRCRMAEVDELQKFTNRVNRSKIIFGNELNVLTPKRRIQNKMSICQAPAVEKCIKKASILIDKETINKWTLTKNRNN